MAVAQAGLVPKDGKNVLMIDDAIETEVTPLTSGYERVDGDFVIERWTQADEARDDEVVVGGMVVVARRSASPQSQAPVFSSRYSPT